MTPLRFALATLALAGAAHAQMPSVWNINSDYHFGSIQMFVPNPGSPPGADEGFLASRGTLDLDTDHTWSLTQTDHEVLADLSVTNQPDTAGGTYAITPDARILFDANPSNPGTDVFEAMVDRDVAYIMSARNQASEGSWLTVATLASAGRTTANLNGTFRIRSFGVEYPDLNGIVTLTLNGTATFDGGGNMSITGQEEEVDAFHVSTINMISGSETYSVSPNGALQIGTEAFGGMSWDGEFFFVVGFDPMGTYSELVVGVKIPDTNDLTTVEGDWAVFGKTCEAGLLNGPRTQTRWAIAEVHANGSSSGTFTMAGDEYTSDALGVSSTPIAFNGGVAAAGPNRFTLSTGGGSQTFDFSPSGHVMIGGELDGTTNLTLAMRTCPGSMEYGTATPGTGGIAPTATMEAFPVLGGSFFALGAIDALPFSTAGLLITLGELPGVPVLGGTLWVDPGRLIAVPPQTVDPLGEARWLLTPPSDPVWLSHDLFTQVLVIDPAAPGGLAMSKGLRTAWCK
ncbi:MAG: hypothetical protein KDB80_18465 [Planctomycetes bacterium]|nr:hypothetical protein [Planctomycetota bacterium]